MDISELDDNPMNLTKDQPKIYPTTTPEVAKMFGMPVEAVPAGIDLTKRPGFPADLPVVEVQAQAHTPALDNHDLSSVRPPFELSHAEPAGSKPLNFLKTVTPYVAVFSVALFIYFYFFNGSGIDFGKILPSSQTVAQTPKEVSLSQLQSQNLSGYQQWIGQFYYDVSDPKVLDPNADNSGNGLSNFQKYLLNLNPKSYDTLGLGMSDSDALQAGISPITGDKLTADQQATVDKYFDFEVISNRQTLVQLQKSGEVAGAHIGNTASTFGIQSAQAQTLPAVAAIQATNQGAAAAPVQNPVIKTQPAVATQQIVVSDLDIDTASPGRLEIPSLKIDAPLVWSSDPKNFDQDLQSGVIHYPGTAMPGQIGTTYISGHSSNYVWAKGSYNHVFTQLDKLADNTSFGITVKTKDGKTHVLHYVVVGRQQYNPNDQAQFQNSSQSVVALSTCWPVGSTKYRLVVFGQLTQVENQ